MYEPVFVNTCEHLSVEPYAFITKIIKKNTPNYMICRLFYMIGVSKKNVYIDAYKRMHLL